MKTTSILVILTALFSLASSSAFAASSPFFKDYSTVVKKFTASPSQIRKQYCYPSAQSKPMLDECIKYSESGYTKELNFVLDGIKRCGETPKATSCKDVATWLKTGGPETLTPMITAVFLPDKVLNTGSDEFFWMAHESMALNNCLEYIANVTFEGSSFGCSSLTGEIKEGIMTGTYEEGKLLKLFVGKGPVSVNMQRGTETVLVRFAGPDQKKVVFEFNLKAPQKSQFIKLIGPGSAAAATTDYFEHHAGQTGIFDFVMKMFDAPVI